MQKPPKEKSITGRRPYLSDRAPSSGAQTNCMMAYVTLSHPPILAALLTSVWPRVASRLGITGMMMPQPMTSISMVMKMNVSGDLERNGDGGASYGRPYRQDLEKLL